MIDKIRRLVRHSEESEKAIERYLTDRIRSMGGRCLKYSNSGETGYPDRLVLLPPGKVIWVELKSRGKKPTRMQLIRHDELRQLGFDVRVIDSREGVDGLLNGKGGIEYAVQATRIPTPSFSLGRGSR